MHRETTVAEVYHERWCAWKWNKTRNHSFDSYFSKSGSCDRYWYLLDNDDRAFAIFLMDNVRVIGLIKYCRPIQHCALCTRMMSHFLLKREINTIDKPRNNLISFFWVSIGSPWYSMYILVVRQIAVLCPNFIDLPSFNKLLMG